VIQSDLLGVGLVYVYVSILVVVTERKLCRYPKVSRKILHIMTGNIAFILPFFQTREIMAFVAAGPFILFTYIMSPYSPLKRFRGRTSEAGHDLGLVYYAIAWTVLAYVFFDRLEIIAIGIFAMSYGDGLAALFGLRFGSKTYAVFDDEKSFVGSFSMFLFTFVFMVIALLFYSVRISSMILMYLVLIALVAMVVEGLTPKGLDNLSVPFVCAFLYWFLVYM